MIRLNRERIHQLAVAVLRLLVGTVFVVSGFAKAIDPWGTVYKITDYINMLGWHSLSPFVTFGAFALPAVEFLVGVFILVGVYRRLAPLVLVALMAVMTPITLYLAVTDRLADCGCFGDVVTLTNWETFFKNIVLLAAGVYLLIYNRRVKNLYGFGVQWMVWALSLAFVLALEYYGYGYQPLLDFRPFKVGTKLYNGPKANAEDEDEFVFMYKKDGVVKEFTIDSLPGDDWEYVDRKVKMSAPITMPDLSSHIAIYDENDDVTSKMLNGEGSQLMFLFPDLEGISITYTYLLNELNEFAQEHGVETFGVSAGDGDAVANWNDLSMAQYDMYFMDDTEMKMLARGNPALVYLVDGKVVWKRTLQSVSSELMQEPDADMLTINSDFVPLKVLRNHVIAYVLLMIVVLFVNRTHSVVKFSIKRLKKNHKKSVTLQEENENDN